MKIGKILLALILTAALVVVVVFVAGNYTGEVGAGENNIVINEVMLSNKGAVPDGSGGYPDWVELYNQSEKTVDISGFGLSDDLFGGVKYALPTGSVLAPGELIVIWCSGESTTPMHAPFKLSETDSVVLFDASGNPVDSMELISVASGMTLSRDENGEYTAMRPSPGYENTEAGIAAYEAGLFSTEDIGVYINEFMASNATTIADANGEYSDWIELYNSNDYEVDISGFGISDSVSQPMKTVLPQDTAIAAKGYLLIYCSGAQSEAGASELHVPFGLAAYEEEVVLSDANGRILDSVAYSRQQADISMARTPDGTGEFAESAQPSPGCANTDDGYAMASADSGLPLTGLVINEMMGANSATLEHNGEYYDWVELYNGTGAAMSLAGYGISDNPKNPAKWVFPDITIDAGEYLVLYASDLNIADAQKKNDLHLNFCISAAGETVFLFDPTGKLIDKLSAGSFLDDVSCGRESGARTYYTEATPGAANGTGYAGITSTVAFSVTPGVFDSAVTLALDAGAGETVYYTLDCTEPDSSSAQYTSPLTVSENTVVRAVAIKSGYITSSCITGTYLFTTDGASHALPIATLVMEPDDLWNSATGIYAYGDKYDPDAATYADMLVSSTFYESKLSGDEAFWERPAAFAIFDETGTQVFSQNIGARIAGSFGRGRAQKGFNLIARDEYGDSRMAYAFFGDEGYGEYKALVLRAGGQDQNRAKIRDELAAGLLVGSDVNFLYQRYTPYVLYLNGEYWGVYFLKEKRNRFLVAQYEGVADAENMDIGYASTHVTYGDNSEWLSVVNYATSHDLSVQANYDYVAERIDVNSFMDYMICEIYVGNTDNANIQYYCLDGGKWKWIYYDFCWGFGSASHNTLSYRRGDAPAASGLFNAMLKNASWRDAFIRRFAELMNTVYSTERVVAKIDELYTVVEPEIAREREKFNTETFMGQRQRAENLGSYDSFVKQIETLKTWAAERPGYMKQYIQAEFGLSDAFMSEVFG